MFEFQQPSCQTVQPGFWRRITLGLKVEIVDLLLTDLDPILPALFPDATQRSRKAFPSQNLSTGLSPEDDRVPKRA